MLRRLFPVLFCFISLFGLIEEANSRHMYGGNINYIYMRDTVVGGQTLHLYTVILTAYYDCNDTRYPFTGAETISIYEGPLNATSLPLSSKVTDLQLIWVDSTTLRANLPAGCAVSSNVCVGKVNYANQVLLPTTFTGYHFVFDRCCRQVLTNISGAVNTVGSLFHSWTASTATKNSSPVFRDLSRPFLCQGQEKALVNLALDLDGNQLNYEFYHPFDGEADAGNVNHNGGYTTWPPDTVTYVAGHSVNQPFGPTGSASINGLTGLASIKAPAITGEYVVGVKVKEIDANGFTVGVVNREFQFPIISCNDTNRFTPNLITGSQTDYVIDAGDSLCFDIEFESKGAPLAFEYEVSGEPFGPTVNPAATQSIPQFTGQFSKQEICWKTTCPQGRKAKYFFTASIADSACLPGDTAIVFSIQVNPFEGPQQISGLNGMCAGSPSVTYSTDTIAGATYNWTVTGGTIVGGGSGPSITVDWGNGPGGNVRVSASSQFGCSSDPIDFPVFVSTFPVRPGSDQTICLGDTATLGSTSALPTAPAGFSIKWSPSATLDSDTAQNPRAFPTQTTTYSITVTDTTGLCTVVDSVTITVLQNTTAGISTPDTTICEGSQIQLQAFGGRFYKWSPASAVSNDTIINPFTTINSTTQITCLISDTGSACPALDTVTITVDTKSQITAGLDSSICAGESYMLGANPNGPVGSTYLWTPNTGLSSDTVGAPIYTPTGTGSATFILQVTTPAGCVFADTVNVQTDTVPILQIDVAQDTICQGEMDTINVQGANTYTWIPSTLPQFQSFQFVMPDSTTTYIVTGTDLNFCSATDSATIVVNPIPVITIGFDSVFLCLGDTMTATTTAGASRYKWTPNAFILPHDSASNPQLFPNTSTQYIVSITDLNGCDNVDSLFVLVDDTVPTDAGPAQTICFPDTIQIGGSPTSPLFNTTFSWSPGSTLVDSTQANPLSFTSSSILYTVTSRNGNCLGFDTVRVNVSPRPVLSYRTDTFEVCRGDSVRLDTNGLTGTIASFAWTPTGGLSDSTTVTPLASPDSLVTYRITYTDIQGCAGSTDVTVAVTTTAQINAGNDTVACEGQSITLNVTGGDTYSWSPGSVLDDSTSSSPTATLTSTTTFVVLGTNSLGCSGSDTITVNVAPAPAADAGGPFIVCSDTINSIRLGGNPTGPTGATYAWSAPQNLDDVTIANPTTTLILPKVYYVIVTDTNGCKSTDSAVVDNFSFDVVGSTVECNDDSAQLAVININGTGPFTYLWTPNYALNSDTIANPVSTPDSSVVYNVVVTDSRGCTSSADAFVDIKNNVRAVFTVDISADCDNAVATTVNQSLNANTYEWFVDGSLVSEDFDVQIPLEFDRTYQIELVAKNDGSCSDSSSLTQSVLAFGDYFEGKIPNVFTPNDDGFNDLFDIRIGNRLEECTSIRIFNRWGIMVYESKGNVHTWDGRTFTGEKCESGVYFYNLDINGTTYNGNVTLIRD